MKSSRSVNLSAPLNFAILSVDLYPKYTENIRNHNKRPRPFIVDYDCCPLFLSLHTLFLVYRSSRDLKRMWRAGVDIKTITNTEDDDDWETDPDFVVKRPLIMIICT